MTQKDTLDTDFDFDDDEDTKSNSSQNGNPNFRGTLSYNGKNVGGWSSGSAGSSKTLTAPGTGSSVIAPIQPSTNVQIMASSGDKYFIQYIIVLSDGMCLELDEQKKITPREMIGICKFINMVQMVSMTGTVEVLWSDLIEELGIARHFTAGFSDYTMYSTDAEVLYVFLFEPIA